MGSRQEIRAADGGLSKSILVNKHIMISYEYKPENICSSLIKVFIDENDNTVKSVAILGGCHGNLTAIMRLLKGRTV